VASACTFPIGRGLSNDQSHQCVVAFAEALDRDDFVAAGGYLAAACTYESPSGVIEGAGEIIASYRRNSEWAHRTFDEITFDSQVDAIDERTFRITYFDETLHRGKPHEYRCCQIVTVGDDGKIVHIKHEEIPGEREKLEAYLKEVGVTREGS